MTDESIQALVRADLAKREELGSGALRAAYTSLAEARALLGRVTDEDACSDETLGDDLESWLTANPEGAER